MCIRDRIETGLQEGAKLVLDGRDITVPCFENGFYLGPTILDHVTEEMTVGSCEILGRFCASNALRTLKKVWR